jgi:hypothetical protein
LSRSCGRTNSQSRNLRRLAMPRSRVRSKAEFMSTITPCGLQRATAMGACSKAARKVVPGLAPAGESDDGNGVAVFILILSRGTIPRRKRAMAIRYLGVPKTGAMSRRCLPFRFRSHYRRIDPALRRTSVTQNQERSVENSVKDYFSTGWREIKSSQRGRRRLGAEGIRRVYGVVELRDWRSAIDFGSLRVTGEVKRKVRRRPFCTRTPSDGCMVARANRLEV